MQLESNINKDEQKMERRVRGEVLVQQQQGRDVLRGHQPIMPRKESREMFVIYSIFLFSHFFLNYEYFILVI
jgi:hypothetical protein